MCFFRHSCIRDTTTMWRVPQHLPDSAMARCLPISKKLILKQLDKPFKRATERSIDRSTFHVSDSGGIRLGDPGNQGNPSKLERRQNMEVGFLEFMLSTFNWKHHHCMEPNLTISVNLDQFNQFHCLTYCIHESKYP